MRNRHGCILTLACALIIAGPARSRAQGVDTAKDEARAIKAMVEDSIGWYRVFVDASCPRCHDAASRPAM